jgi:hypothetical protein
MRPAGRPVQNQAVPTRALTVTLEIELDSQPIAGRLRGAGGEIDFAGWLGLAAALERALEDATVARHEAGPPLEH